MATVGNESILEPDSEEEEYVYKLSDINNEIIEKFKNNPLSRSEHIFPKESLLSQVLPSCYTEFAPISPKIELLHEETLFYIFYSFNDENLRLQAFNTLIKKNYLYSSKINCFVLATKNIPDNSKKNILIFDPLKWEKVMKEIIYDEEFVNSLKA
ncbi:hypothetical protein CWI37_2884p0010, partial [Hamiltosporidium tvaerminnensis]